MAKLTVKDKVALGKYLIETAQTEPDDKARVQLRTEPIATLEKYLVIPEKHTIIIHEDSGDVTHMVLPWKDDVDDAMDQIDTQTSIYPDEYRSNSADYIDDSKSPRIALQFRFGEYMFGRCKH